VSTRNTPIDASNYTRAEIRAVIDEARRNGRTVAAHAHGGEGVDLCVEEGVHSIEHGALLNETNVRAMAERGTWLVLTNTILFHSDGIERGDAAEPSIMAKVKGARRAVEQSFERIVDAGLRFALGTDSMHGLFGCEMSWLVERGVGARDAIVAATRNGAEVLGLHQQLGTLERGKRADIVVLPGNPLTDIEVARHPRAVIRGGRLVVPES
jgi:imidazolonepropionase-like amidohydrolase